MATKNSGQKKKRTPKKRKPKITLDNKKVLALASLMVFLCALFLSLAFVFSNGGSRNSGADKEKTAVEKKVSEKKSQKKNGGKKTPEKKQPEKKDEKVPAAEGGNSATVQSEPVQQKKESGGQKKPEEKNSSVKAGEQKKPEVQPQKKSEKKQEPKAEEKKVPEKKEAPKETKQEIKKEAKEEKKAAAKFNIPQSSNGARLCFIIDDGGQTTANIRKYTTLPFKLTVAVLPRLPCTKESARIVVQDGKELMLHQPMQAQNLKMNPGPGAILPDMTLGEIYSTVIQNLSELGPGVKGLNNHEGSLITCDEMMIGTVIDAAIERGVYFVDSRTTKDTKAPMAALERDVKILQREVFIDDIIDRDEMLKQIMRGIDIANKKGKVIMIGHVDKSAKILPQLLLELYPELKEKGYRLVFPSELL